MFTKLKKANQYLLGFSLLNLSPLLWGSSYVVLKQTLDSIPPCILTLISYCLAALCFAPFLKLNRGLTRAGLELGFWLLLGSATQTTGLQYTSANRSAFITTLYVVLVPLLISISVAITRLFSKKVPVANIIASTEVDRVKTPIWFTAMLALTGVGILSYDRYPPNIGDLWTVGTACSYALYIIRIENYANKFNSLSLAAAQLFGATCFSLLWVLTEQSYILTDLQLFATLPWSALLYLGLVVTASSIFVQTWGQARVKSTQAALIYTLEPVWGIVFAYLILGEVLGWRGWLGAILIIMATVVSQLSASFEQKSTYQ